MGLGKWLSGLFGGSDLTRDWVEDSSRELHVDLDMPSLGGVAVGQPFSDLSWLGPADSGAGTYDFHKKGLTVGEREGDVDMLAMEFHRNDGFEPFQGSCSAKEQPLTLSPATTPEELIAQLGEPAYREVEAKERYDQLTLGYHLGAEFAFNFPDSTVFYVHDLNPSSEADTWRLWSH